MAYRFVANSGGGGGGGWSFRFYVWINFINSIFIFFVIFVPSVSFGRQDGICCVCEKGMQ